jgi:arabinan endo-1,5-alpha-L-arabinosidase
MKWSTGEVDKVRVERGRDWENKKPCLIFTGLDQDGTAIWGKKWRHTILHLYGPLT